MSAHHHQHAPYFLHHHPSLRGYRLTQPGLDVEFMGAISLQHLPPLELDVKHPAACVVLVFAEMKDLEMANYGARSQT